MAWQKGQSGNPGGRVKSTHYRDALIMALKEAGDDMPTLREIARTLVMQARAGDITTNQFIRDTVDGKPAQRIEQDEPFVIQHKIIRYEVIEPDARRRIDTTDSPSLPAPIRASKV